MLALSRRSLGPSAVVLAAVVAAVLLAFAELTGSYAILGLLFVVAAAAVVLADWTIGVPLLLLVSATDGFLKHLSGGALTFILKDALLALVLLGLTLRLGMSTRERSDVHLRGALAWAIFMGYLATQLLHPAISLAGAVGAFRAHAWFGLLFVVGTVYFRERSRLTSTMNFAIFVCAICAAGALIQHAAGDRWMHLSAGFLKASLHYASFPSIAARAAGVHGASYRMYGTLVDPASLGLACSYGILIGAAGLARLRGLWRWLTVVAIVGMAIALLLSQTRSAMAGLGGGVVVLAVLLATRKSTRPFALATILLIVAAVPIGYVLTNGRVADRVLSTDSVAYASQTRNISRDQTLYELPRFPLGHGLGSTGAGGNLRDGSGFAVDNVYFATLYETGIPGLLIFLGLQGAFLWLGIRAALRTADVGARTAFAGIVAGQSALLISSWFTQGAFDYAPLAQFFWLFSGAVARAEAFE